MELQGVVLVIEVRSHREKEGYKRNERDYGGRAESLFSEVFAGEIGFGEFRQINKNFEYRIIFDASLQRRQQELYETIKDAGK